jgi:8-oxo-dGTP pyrophosphatase MutT (NUDIX family)
MGEWGDAMVRGVVVVVRRDGRFLLIRRGPGVIVPDAWCFVGGAIEAGESEEGAVVREFREELGGSVRPVRRIWEWDRPDGKLRLYWWLAELTDARFDPNPVEVAEVRWCTAEEIDGLAGVLESNRLFLNAVGRELIGGGRGAG